MDENTGRGRINWALPGGTGAGLLILSLALIVYTPYAVFPLVLVVLPLISITLIVLLLIAIVRKRKRFQASAAATLVIVFATSFAVLKLQDSIRETLRWHLWSNRFKTQLQASASFRPGELKHMEWQGTGFAGVANDTIYLVFDPADALASAAQTGSPGTYSGLPCDVLKVRRLEAHWYSVRFYTDEAWGERNQLDCSGTHSP